MIKELDYQIIMTEQNYTNIEKALFEAEDMFIDEMMQCDEPHHWLHYDGFHSKKADGKVKIWLDDIFIDWLKDTDHGCTASPEDGCSFCGMLIDLGLKKDNDYDLNDLFDNPLEQLDNLIEQARNLKSEDK